MNTGPHKLCSRAGVHEQGTPTRPHHSRSLGCLRGGAGEPHSQSPVDSDDEGDVVSGQSHRGKHDDHGDEPSLGDASCPDAGRGGRDAVGGAGRGRGGAREAGLAAGALAPRRKPECQGLWGQPYGAGVVREATVGSSRGGGVGRGPAQGPLAQWPPSRVSAEPPEEFVEKPVPGATASVGVQEADQRVRSTST